jgi:hypothetical protein
MTVEVTAIAQMLNSYLSNPPFLDGLDFKSPPPATFDNVDLSTYLNHPLSANEANLSLFRYNDWFLASISALNEAARNAKFLQAAKGLTLKLKAHHSSLMVSIEALARHSPSNDASNGVFNGTEAMNRQLRILEAEISISVKRYDFPDLTFINQPTIDDRDAPVADLLPSLDPESRATETTLSHLIWIQKMKKQLHSTSVIAIPTDRLVDFQKGMSEHHSNILIHVRTFYIRQKEHSSSVISCFSGTSTLSLMNSLLLCLHRRL